ncbi:MAG: hypothetical protein FWG00_04970 [Coriobacteriia bacterium]|nr:hypothetical protein [Coriobacteriia bacterium]
MKADENYELVAVMNKPKGLKGEIVVAAPSNLPLRLYEGLEVWIVPPTLTGVRHTRVAQMSEQAKGVVIRLEGVDDGAAARELAGRFLLARAGAAKVAEVLSGATAEVLSDGDDYDGASFADVNILAAAELATLIGCSVVDAVAGELGELKRTEDNPAHPLLVVSQGGTADAKELLIPFVDEFIVSISEDIIEVRLPQGLLELNAPAEKKTSKEAPQKPLTSKKALTSKKGSYEQKAPKEADNAH